jgi:signal transduction histidine kinase
MNTNTPATLVDEKTYKLISKDLYKQNAELAMRNKTLQIFHTLSVIAMVSMNLKDVAQKIVDAVAYGLGFSCALISLIDKESNYLRPVAITHAPTTDEAFQKTFRTLEDCAVDLRNDSNLMVRSLKEVKRQVTGNLLDIFSPHITQKTADTMENISGIKTLIVYPIVLGERKLGVFTLGINKKVDDMSTLQRETLEQIMDLIGLAIDRAQLHENLSLANTKLLENDKYKDEFISIASHNLRTPIVAIRGYVWLLMQNKQTYDAKSQNQLQKIYESIENLIGQVNDILDISRLESGKIENNPEQFDIGQLANQVQEEVAGQALPYNIQIKSDIPDSSFVFADRNLIHQVLTNLLGNAIKFSPENGKITITCIRQKNYMCISVSDNGIGIRKEDMPHLFTKFGHIDADRFGIPQTGGSGLGLFICKQFVELSQGTIGVKSAEGKGSVFTFSLPVE